MQASVCLAIFALLTIWNIAETIRGIRAKIDYEIYTHLGMAIFSATLFVGFLGFSNAVFIAIFQRNPIGIVEVGKWIGLAIAAIGGIPPLLARVALKSKGEEEVGHIRTTRLVTSGIYKYVRHPMRLGLFIMGFGLMFWRLSIASVIAYLMLATCASIASPKEEKSLMEKFGDEYREYMQTVPRLNIISGLIKSIRDKNQ